MKRLLCLTLCLLLLPALAGASADSTRGQDALSSLISGDTETLFGQFTDQMKVAVPQKTLQAVWAQVTAQCGDFVSFTSETAQNLQNYEVRSILLHMTARDIEATVTFDQAGLIAGLNLAPAPTAAPETVLPDGVVETKITVDDGSGHPLPGLLTMPQSGESLPAVVLVHGSGPNDRNESIGQTKLFEDIAHFLAQNGIASVRYDKRTYVYGALMTKEELTSFTVQEETIKDAIAAGHLLAQNERVDAAHIYVCGHSMGAMLAPRIASESNGLFSGMALLSGSPYTLAKILYDQNIAAISGLDKDAYAAYKAQLDQAWAEYEALFSMTADQQKATTAFGVSGYYWATLCEEPVKYIKEMRLPVLIINGEEDFQVTSENGFYAWREALASEEYVQLLKGAGLNHLLMCYTGPDENKGTVKEYDTPAHVDSRVLTALSTWILEQNANE